MHEIIDDLSNLLNTSISLETGASRLLLESNHEILLESPKNSPLITIRLDMRKCVSYDESFNYLKLNFRLDLTMGAWFSIDKQENALYLCFTVPTSMATAEDLKEIISNMVAFSDEVDLLINKL